jgi:hypothetical protein
MPNNSAFRIPHSELVSQRAHDYAQLVRRWRRVASVAGLRMQTFARKADYDLYWLQSKYLAARGGVYISAGIHGDEPAGTEALITWAGKNVKTLKRLPCMLFPCLNPWGLVNNSRFDEDGRDLNRLFQHDGVPMIKSLKALLKPHRFSLALTLHEDFDGQGLYIYEPQYRKPHWGEDLLKIASRIIPIEKRVLIDGRRSVNGLLRRKLNLKKFPMIPEAVYLHLHHAERTFTIESPSEFALDQRVRAQVAIIAECIRRVSAR